MNFASTMVNSSNLITLNIKKRKKAILLTFSVLFCSFFTDTVLFGTNSNAFFTTFNRVFVVLFAIYLLYKTQGIKTTGFVKNRNTFALVCVFFIVFTMIMTGRLLNGYYYVTVISCIIIAVCMSKLFTLDEFAPKYVSFLTFIASFSLIIFAFNRYLYRLPFLPTITNTAGYTYKFLLFTNVPTGSNHLSRNEGPYWEAGAYQMYLNLALMLTLFSKYIKHRYFKAVLFSISAVSTLSAAALIPMVLIYVAYFLKKETNENNANKRLILGTALIGGILILLSGNVERVFLILSSGTTSSSFAYRFSSAYSDLSSFLLLPLWGTNPDVLTARRSAIGASYGLTGNVGITNTVAGWFGLFGFSLPILMISNYWLFLKRFQKNIIIVLLLFVAIIAMTSNENFTSSPIIFIFPFLISSEEFEVHVGHDNFRN